MVADSKIMIIYLCLKKASLYFINLKVLLKPPTTHPVATDQRHINPPTQQFNNPKDLGYKDTMQIYTSVYYWQNLWSIGFHMQKNHFFFIFQALNLSFFYLTQILPQVQSREIPIRPAVFSQLITTLSIRISLINESGHIL